MSSTSANADNSTAGDERNKRVLSIQSHVVSGYVGNKAAVFPLQLLGFDVDVINSVQFSNHTGYPHGYEGEVLDSQMLGKLVKGLERNGLLSGVGNILTGYIGSESILRAVVDVVKKVKDMNPKCRYLCDPVLGDRGEFYVPKELVNIYREEILPLADVVTPNQFEVEQLTGITIQTIQDAQRACEILHDSGVSLVLITSIVFPEGGAIDREDAIAAEASAPSPKETKRDEELTECEMLKELRDTKLPISLRIVFAIKLSGAQEDGTPRETIAKHVNDHMPEGETVDSPKFTTILRMCIERKQVVSCEGSRYKLPEDEDVLISPSHDSIGMFASCRQCKVADETEDEQYIMFTPKFPGHFTGTGDVCAALFLGWTADNDSNLACSLEKLAGAMNAIVERTANASAKKRKQSNSSSSPISAPELQLVQSRDDILHPPRTFRAVKVSTNNGGK